MKPVKVGMLGLGTVGTGVVKIAEGHQSDLQRRVGAPIEITMIAVKNIEKTRSVHVSKSRLTEDPYEVINHPEIDVIIEVMGGVEQTKPLVIAALQQRKHVVTANKDLMALHGHEILKVAAEYECDVFYEASVAGGIPILRTIVDGFSADRITKIMGIVNGTTNFILSKMSEEGATYSEVLAEAMQLGYAEADPSSDVDGLDAAYKMVILSMLGFRMNVEVADVAIEGITKVSAQDILYGKRLGYEVKLLGIADRSDDLISVSVQPTMVNRSHPLASVNGVNNAVYVYGEAVGETMFYGPGAGEMPTATSVVADLVAVAKNLKLGINGKVNIVPQQAKKLKSDAQISCKYFLLLHVADKAGVLHQITQVLSDYDISLQSVLQQPTGVVAEAEITIITHDASKASLKQAIDAFNRLDVVFEVKSVYRVEG